MSSTTNLITRELEAMILDGTLKPGERFPSERKLCQRYYVSRSTLREALNALRSKGIVKTLHGNGTYVAVFDDFAPSTPLRELLITQPHMLNELMEVRATLEGEASYLAAQRATEDDHYLISTAYNLLVHSTPNDVTIKLITERDMKFHRSIYQAANNTALLMALNGIRDLMMSYAADTGEKLYKNNIIWRKLNTQHRRIYKAIISRNPAAARRAAQQHIHTVYGWLTKSSDSKSIMS